MDAIRRLNGAVGYLRKAAGEIEVQQIECLLQVMIEHPEPVTHSDIGDRVGLSQSSVSRNLKRLGVRMRQDVKGNWMDAGWGLVDTRPDLYETRKLASTLTSKGVQLMKDLRGVL